MNLISVGLAAAAWLASATPSWSQTAPSLEGGVKQAQEGKYQSAIVMLDQAVRQLENWAGAERQWVRANVYLALSYQGLAQESKARETLQRALTKDPQLQLSPGEFPPSLIALLAQVRGDAPPQPLGAPPPGSPTLAPQASGGGGGGKVALIVVGLAAAGGGAVALAAGGKEDATPTAAPTAAPTTTPAPTAATPTPTARPTSSAFERYYGDYIAMVYTSRDADCDPRRPPPRDGVSSLPNGRLNLSGRSDGSNFTVAQNGVLIAGTGRISPDGSFECCGDPYRSISGVSTGASVSGRMTWKQYFEGASRGVIDCVFEYSGRNPGQAP